MCEQTDWYCLYGEGWKGVIVDAAFVHPAKFARALIRHIYAHAVEEGWLKPGDSVLDPFGGVALGALDAMSHGLHWMGVELEERFVDLGNDNIALWNRLHNGAMPRWGSAALLQGDSRKLAEVLAGRGVEAAVSSPPFGSTNTKPTGLGDGRPTRATGQPAGWRGYPPFNIGLFPQQGHPDAAGSIVQRFVFAQARCGPALPGL